MSRSFHKKVFRFGMCHESCSVDKEYYHQANRAIRHKSKVILARDMDDAVLPEKHYHVHFTDWDAPTDGKLVASVKYDASRWNYSEAEFKRKCVAK